MPIYAYRCEACGFAKDALQKVSDPLLTVCPSCGAATFKKQLTAAGFQLKGTGWYATDFRNGSGAKVAPPADAAAKAPDGAATPAAAGEAGIAKNGGADASASSATPSSPAAASKPAATPQSDSGSKPSSP